MPRLLQRCGVECYVTGNYSRAEAIHLGQHVHQLLKVFNSILCVCNLLVTYNNWYCLMNFKATGEAADFDFCSGMV